MTYLQDVPSLVWFWFGCASTLTLGSEGGAQHLQVPKAVLGARGNETVCCRRSSGAEADVLKQGSTAHGMFRASSQGVPTQLRGKHFTNCNTPALTTALWR